MAKIIVGNEEFTDVKEAQKAMAELFGITEECALWYMLWDVSFEDEAVNDAFISENEDNGATSVQYVEAYLKHDESENLEYPADAALKNYNSICEMC